MIAETTESISRTDLLGWINEVLKLNLTKIEQLGTGAVHCQLLDVVHPGKVPLHKVNWRAKFEYEFVYNFKILQQSFTKFNIPKYIDVERLVKARYQDNLEFAQWMRKYVKDTCPNWKDYDPIARRGNIELDFTFTEKNSTKPSTAKDSVAKGSVSQFGKGKFIMVPRATGVMNTSTFSQKSGGSVGAGLGVSSGNLFTSLSAKDNEILTDLNNMIERQKAERSPQMEIMRAERDFYYSKLRDIDHVLDVFKGNNVEQLINNIREVLYLTPEKIAIVCEDGDIKIKNKDDGENNKENNRDDEDVIMMDNTGSNIGSVRKSATKDKVRKVSLPTKNDEVMVIEEDSVEIPKDGAMAEERSVEEILGAEKMAAGSRSAIPNI